MKFALDFEVALKSLNENLHNPDLNTEIIATLLGYETENMTETECRSAVYAFLDELNERISKGE